MSQTTTTITSPVVRVGIYDSERRRVFESDCSSVTFVRPSNVERFTRRQFSTEKLPHGGSVFLLDATNRVTSIAPPDYGEWLVAYCD